MDNIVKKASEYVTGLLTNKLPSECTYHNLAHTLRVVEAVEEIGKNSGLSDVQLEILLLSAWFHDTGFVKAVKGHEVKSIEIANDFLKANAYPAEKTDIINKIINVTEIGRKPVDTLEMIIRDADILHIGKEGFFEKSFSLKHEWEMAGIKKYTETEWIKSGIDFLSRTEFYTRYAKTKYEEGRQKNISHLKKMLQ